MLLLGGGAIVMTDRPDEQIAPSEVESALILDLPPVLPSSKSQSDADEGPEQPAVDAAPRVLPRAVPNDAQHDDAPVIAQAVPLDRPVTRTPPTAAASQEAAAPAGSGVAVAATIPAHGAAPSRPSGQALSVWQRALLTRLEQAKAAAHAGGLSGTVRVAFTIDRVGRLRASRILRSSGSARLDQTALALLSHAAPFPPPPTGVADEALTFAVPILFARAH